MELTNLKNNSSTDLLKIKTCIIGAGAAGLCTAKLLADYSNDFDITIFEKGSELGGTWVYDEQKYSDDGNEVSNHSSMYKNLRTNLPKEIMCFPDFDKINFSSNKNNQSCVSHEVILEYLNNYVCHFQLRQYIQFNTVVTKVKPMHSNNSFNKKWSVIVKNKTVADSKEREQFFDVIFVCNGHFSAPYCPKINGIESFPGKVLHSHSYREPYEFQSKTVILLGASSSGIDIAADISSEASHVYLSHNKERLTQKLAENVTEVYGIEKIVGNTFFFNDKNKVKADVFMYCTGYLYNFPFLEDSCKIKVDENYVTPLYKQMVNIEHPSMFLIGIPMNVIPFPLFHIQVKFAISILKGKFQLPSKSKMLEDSILQVNNKRHAHRLGELQFFYLDELSELGNFEKLQKFYCYGYYQWSMHRCKNIRIYKNSNLLVGEDKKTVKIISNS